MMRFMLLVSVLCLSVYSAGESAACHGEDLTGTIRVPSDYSGLSADTVVVCCRNNQFLARCDVDTNGSFSITQPDDGLPFNLIVVSSRFPPIVIKDLVAIHDTLTLGVREPFQYTPEHPEVSKEYLRSLQSVLRSLEDARDLLPPDEDLHLRLQSVTDSLVAQQPVDLLVPAYFHPATSGAEWNRLFALAKAVNNRLVVILNVNSGSGNRTGVETAYQDLVRQLNSRQIPWVGYIDVAYGKKPLLDMTADLHFWMNNYPGMSGVFLDQVSSLGSEAEFQFCAEIHKQFTQGRIRDYAVIGNPGTSCSETLAAPGNFTSLCVAETPHDRGGFSRPIWAESHPDVATGAIIYNVDSPQLVEKVLTDLVTQRGRFLYVTDQDGVSETLWTRLPDDQLLSGLVGMLDKWNSSIAANERSLKQILDPSRSRSRR